MGLAWYVFYLSDCCDHTDDLQESKLFDVANSLADVMIIMPSMNHESHFGIGPRDLIHSLRSAAETLPLSAFSRTS
jgi:hypothetical protein